MWIDDRGGSHVVALPDPTDVMSDGFRESLDLLAVHAPEDVAELIEDEQDEFFDEAVDQFGGDGEAEFVEAPAPGILFSEPVSTVEDLRALVRAVDARWRLDALSALDHYLP